MRFCFCPSAFSIEPGIPTCVGGVVWRTLWFGHYSYEGGSEGWAPQKPVNPTSSMLSARAQSLYRLFLWGPGDSEDPVL